MVYLLHFILQLSKQCSITNKKIPCWIGMLSPLGLHKCTYTTLDRTHRNVVTTNRITEEMRVALETSEEEPK